MNLIKQLNEMAGATSPAAMEEIARLANYWREEGRGMNEEELVDAIGMDLEMLEYSPEQVEIMVPLVLDALRGGM